MSARVDSIDIGGQVAGIGDSGCPERKLREKSSGFSRRTISTLVYRGRDYRKQVAGFKSFSGGFFGNAIASPHLLGVADLPLFSTGQRTRLRPLSL